MNESLTKKILSFDLLMIITAICFSIWSYTDGDLKNFAFFAFLFAWYLIEYLRDIVPELVKK